MEVSNRYLKNYKQKYVNVDLPINEAKYLLFSLKRDPQKSDFVKRLISQLEKYIKMAEEFRF